MNHQDSIAIAINEELEALEVQARSIGNTTLEIASSMLKTAFYWKFVVTSSIVPFHPRVHVGETVTFSITPESQAALKGGYWITDDDNVARVTSQTGIATAVGVGTTKIIYKAGGATTTHSPITVYKITSAKLDSAAIPSFLVLNTKLGRDKQQMYRYVYKMHTR